MTLNQVDHVRTRGEKASEHKRAGEFDDGVVDHQA